MTTRTFSTSNPPECPVFTHLRNGTKTVEGRPYSKKYHAVKAGDVIAFKHGSSESVAAVCYGGFGSGGSWSPAVYEAVGRCYYRTWKARGAPAAL
jgi:hypothetical protein